MAAGLVVTSTTGEAKGNDELKAFFTQNNKLEMTWYDTLVEEGIDYSDLVDSAEDDLRDLLKECNLKQKAIIRIINAVRKLPHSTAYKKLKETQVSIVSTAEQEATLKIQKESCIVSDKISDVSTIMKTLEQKTKQCEKLIKDSFDNIVQKANKRKEELLQQLKTINDSKYNNLLSQQNLLKDRVKELDDFYNETQIMIKDTSIDLQKRKIKILSQTETILNKQNDDDLQLLTNGNISITIDANEINNELSLIGSVCDTTEIPLHAQQDDNDTILIETAEMIAPMTRIKGIIKLTSTSITFIPNKEQPSESKEEINLALNPPPLPILGKVNKSHTRGRSSSHAVIKRHRLSNAIPDLDKNSNASKSQLHSMVLNNGRNNEYFVATSSCSSLIQVGGTRYRLMSAHRVWLLKELREIYYRRYQLENCALELFFSDDTSWLFNLYDEDNRNRLFDAVMSLSSDNLIESKEFFKNPRKALQTSKIHVKWCRRQMTNFEYLMRMNILAGRTFNDLTQYPVFPWVIQDYKSDTIDLNDRKIYRDLSKPVGALNEKRLQKFIERYESLCQTRDMDIENNISDEDKMHCFMYGTHYSSIGIVLYYLMRMQPFTTYHLKFQDGKFDGADRLFHNIGDSFNSCLMNTGDVKELIPEFYYLTDFLLNKQNLELGVLQTTNEKVGNVQLPPWADNNPEKFIKIMREALESEYVSSHLHHWIDLIFGYKQQGKKAELSNNVFHPYTYSGSISIHEIENPTRRKAILLQIAEFGQTPIQLFHKPHPERIRNQEVLQSIFQSQSVKLYSKQHLTNSSDISIVSMSLNEKDRNVVVINSNCNINIYKWDVNKLCIEKKSKTSIADKIANFGKSKKQNKIGLLFSSKISNENLCFATTNDRQYIFACGFDNKSIIAWNINQSKICQTIIKHSDIVSCLALDENIEKQKAILVTGSYDKTIIIWRINIKSNTIKTKSKHKRRLSLKNNINSDSNQKKLIDLIDPIPIHILNTESIVSCVDVSLKSGIVVSCSLDGIINVYNSSTGEHYHILQPFIDKSIKIEKEKEKENNNNIKEESPSIDQNFLYDSGFDNISSISVDTIYSSPDVTDNEYELKLNNNNLESSNELSIIRISSVFGYILCYSKKTKDIFLYGSNGRLITYSKSKNDIYSDIIFSKNDNFILCGGEQNIIRIKKLPSFNTIKKFEDPKESITSIFLDKDETYIFAGLSDGNVLVYSLPQKSFIKSRVGTLSELGF